MANTQAYVTACHAVGYQHPDLTAHAGQVLEWFSCEDGLDLAVLDADCAALRAASAAADDAVRISRDGLAALAAAWDGDSGSVAVGFVERHCARAMVVADALRSAAETCEALRDELARVVDEKVSAAMAIDNRAAGQRPAWLAAAAAVTGGGAERADALDVVSHEIVPYVDADVRTDWLTAMRSATSSVSAAYEAALRQLNACAPGYFEVPGALGAPPPSPVPAPTRTVPASAAPSSMPAAAQDLLAPLDTGGPAAPLPMAATTPAQPLAPDPFAAAPTPPAIDAPASTGMPAMPAMPDVGGGLSGLIGQIADALGGVIDGVPDNAVDEDLPEDLVDEEDPDEEVGDTEDAAPEDDPPIAETPGEDVATEEPSAPDGDVAQPADVEPPPPPPPEAPPAAETPPAAPPPPVVDQPDEQTPCEIAADELPQVGQ